MMDSSSALQARKMLDRYGLKPRKALGQNFLIDPAARELIIEAADLKPEDIVLEIGPGLGALTERLAQLVNQVISVELDADLFSVLKVSLGGLENVELVQADILKTDLSELGLEPGFVVVANIPYNITSAVIRRIMESETPASRVVLTVQKEVAERIISSPGDMNLLAISVQVFGSPAICAHIPAGAFYPAPSVESAVVRVDMRRQDESEAQLLGTLFKLARAGFAQRRKQLKNAFAHALPLDKAGAEQLLRSCDVEPRIRAQKLDIETWYRLARAYQSLDAD